MLATKINDHVAQALARQMAQYQSLAAQYVMLLNGTAPFVAAGTYAPFFTAPPAGTLGFGYGSLVGVGQAFHLAAPTALGQVTLYFKAAGAVSDGLVSCYLYGDNGQSPSVYAVPTGGPTAQGVEVYSTADIAAEWTSLGTGGFLAKTFTFDLTLPAGYYWVVAGSRYPASPGNSLLLGTEVAAGLALANGFYAGQDVTGFWGANGASGSAQLALALASKVSAPPLYPGNALNVSGVGALVAAEADRFQVLENAVFALDEGRQLFNGSTYPAVGAQLDIIGQIVGVARNGQTDDLYRIFILGKIGENFSNATTPDLVALISLLFQTPSLGFMPLYPAEVDVQIPAGAGLPAQFFAEAITIVSRSVGAGIGIGFGSSYPANAFAFTSVGGLPIGGGFGDLNNPSTGGGFAGLFYP